MGNKTLGFTNFDFVLIWDFLKSAFCEKIHTCINIFCKIFADVITDTERDVNVL